MAYGTGRGISRRGGMGFGFRGSSPPWPYVGVGRGGLPRCGYFLSGIAKTAGMSPYPVTTQMSKEAELSFLRNQAQAIRQQLEQIEARIGELEAREK